MKRTAWDDPAVAAQYRAFERRHSRYTLANAALARHAALPTQARVLDLAAGTGGTTAALLPTLGPLARVDCVEPAAAMARQGRERLGPDPRVRWLRTLDDATGPYDRVVCGAAIWQWPDLRRLFRRLASRLAPGGALVFDIPGAYLGQPDGPGGGTDPWLTTLMTRLTAAHPPALTPAHRATSAAALPTPTQIEQALLDTGLHPQRWQHQQRLSQAAWCDWMKIPVLTQALWPRIGAAERTRRIDAAAAGLDMASWRPERWWGWTAWKPAFATRALPDASALQQRPSDLRRRAAQEGALLLRGMLPRGKVDELRLLLLAAARAEGLLGARAAWLGGGASEPQGLPGWVALQQRMAQQPAFQRLVHDPTLLDVVGRVLGRPAQGALGSVCRLAPPEHQVPATGPHRDADYLANSNDVWIAWIPLAPCDQTHGVLAVATGSHRRAAACTWSASSLEPGDVLLLSAHTLHRSCPNWQPRQPRQARLSLDLRFGPSAR